MTASAITRKQRANALMLKLSTVFKQVLPEGREPEYIDMAYITDAIASEFPEEVPAAIRCGLDAARGMMSSGKIESVCRLQRALAGALASGGGLALMWGILTIIAHGVVLTTVTGYLWWKTTAITILFGGPIGIGAGIAMLAAGIYHFSSQKPVREQAMTAFKVIEKAIAAWAAEE